MFITNNSSKKPATTDIVIQSIYTFTLLPLAWRYSE